MPQWSNMHAHMYITIDNMYIYTHGHICYISSDHSVDSHHPSRQRAEADVKQPNHKTQPLSTQIALGS